MVVSSTDNGLVSLMDSGFFFQWIMGLFFSMILDNDNTKVVRWVKL
jgi:hypothetical protein